MKSITLIVDLDDFFGHARMTITARGKESLTLSLADPNSAMQIKRELCRLVDDHGFDHTSTENA